MDGRGRWLDNVFIERLWRSLKYECVYLNAFETGSEARAGIGRWIDFYNRLRPHTALCGITPDIDCNLVKLPKGPGRLLLNYDRACNLACPSCRTKISVDDEETVKKLDTLADRQVFPLLKDAKELMITQTGEALASKHSMRILKAITPEKYPDLKVELYTNMSLFSQNTWEKLGESAKSIKRLFISIDGATKPTLEKLRFGLKWERLLDALNFAKELRLNGDIENIFLSIMLQKDNYQELPALLDMASNYCIDEIMISPLVSHGSYSPEEFVNINVCDPQNPLFEMAKTIIAETKVIHAGMVLNKGAILNSGRSVPSIMWRT